MKENKLADLSMELAIALLEKCDGVKRHRSLVSQLERSSTSIGANIREANYAHSKADFISKLQIALKECYETEYWIELFVKTGMFNREDVLDVYRQCGTIRRLLSASINTARYGKKKKAEEKP